MPIAKKLILNIALGYYKISIVIRRYSVFLFQMLHLWFLSGANRNKMWENRLKWWKHVLRKKDTVTVKVVEDIYVKEKKKKEDRK